MNVISRQKIELVYYDVTDKHDSHKAVGITFLASCSSKSYSYVDLSEDRATSPRDFLKWLDNLRTGDIQDVSRSKVSVQVFSYSINGLFLYPHGRSGVTRSLALSKSAGEKCTPLSSATCLLKSNNFGVVFVLLFLYLFIFTARNTNLTVRWNFRKTAVYKAINLAVGWK